jgi:large subunit ribosomal protein L23
MAIFSKKENTDETVEATAVETTPTSTDTVVTETTPVTMQLDAKASRNLIVPRLSEKAGKMDKLNKYVFTIWGKINKVEARKLIEKQYGVKIDRVNMITVAGKTRRYGRRTGVSQAFKKAIVTLSENSKKIDLVEPS